MKQKFINFFNSLKSGQKRVVAVLALGAIVTVIGLAGYISSSRTAATQPAVKQVKGTVVSMDNKLMAQSDLLNARKEAQVAKEELEEIKKREGEAAKAAAAGLVPPVELMNSKAAPINAEKISTKLFPPVPQPARPMMPPLPPPPNMPPGVPPAPGSSAAVSNPAAEEIGGISLVSNTQKAADSKDDKKKDEKRSVYLAPSFMKATLLTGLYAPIGGDAKNNPVPLMIRVKAPAQLPNDVKARLQGCFVVADGKGNLATHRADIVTVSLSCVDRKGDAVIYEKITGYVTGGDNIAGVKGKVVAKTGQMIARAAVAGAFSGAGEALKSTSQSTSLSALGQVSQFDPNKLAQAAGGGALSEGFKELQKFYMELAHQSMPVIEILPSQPLYVVITTETELHIKKLKKGSLH